MSKLITFLLKLKIIFFGCILLSVNIQSKMISSCGVKSFIFIKLLSRLYLISKSKKKTCMQEKIWFLILSCNQTFANNDIIIFFLHKYCLPKITLLCMIILPTFTVPLTITQCICIRSYTRWIYMFMIYLYIVK